MNNDTTQEPSSETLVEHTPIPWKMSDAVYDHARSLTGEKGMIGRISAWESGNHAQAKGNGDFIVKAVNNHDKLVHALEEIAKAPYSAVSWASSTAKAALETLQD